MSLTGTANCLTFLKNAIFQSNWVGWFWHVPYERKICWYIAFGDSRKLDILILKYRFIVAQAIYFRIELMLDSFFQVSNCWNEYAHALVWLSIQSRFKTHFSLTVIWHWYGFSHCKFICSPSQTLLIYLKYIGNILHQDYFSFPPLMSSIIYIHFVFILKCRGTDRSEYSQSSAWIFF
jgi:hypothetical protein